MKKSLLAASLLLALTSCASFENKAFQKRIKTTYRHLIWKDSVTNGCKKCDSLKIERDKKLDRYDPIRNF